MLSSTAKVLLGVTAFFVFTVSCSLRVSDNKKTVNVSLTGIRPDGPAISAMDYYALSISGNVSNTYSTQQLQGRSLACLNTTGLVYLTSFAELVSGYPVSLAPGNYTFSVVGYSGAGVTGATNLSTVFANSPSLKSYLLAKLTVAVGAAGSVVLTASYSSTNPSDLILDCPPATASHHALLVAPEGPYYLTNSGGSWARTLVESRVVTTSGFFVGNDGFAHVTYGSTTGTPYGVRYASNSSGSFQSEQAVGSANTGSADDSAVLVENSGTVSLFANFNIPAVHLASFIKGVSFTAQSNVLSVSGNRFLGINSAVSSLGTMIAIGASIQSGNPLYISTRPAAGAWAAQQVINTAGATSCTAGVFSPTVRFIPSSDVYDIFYLCDSIATHVLGWATNRGGSLATSSISTVTADLNQISAFSDAEGNIHLVHDNGTASMDYRVKKSSSSTFSNPYRIPASELDINGHAVIAQSEGEVTILVTERDNGGGVLKAHVRTGGGPFETGVVILGVGESSKLNHQAYLQ